MSLSGRVSDASDKGDNFGMTIQATKLKQEV